MLQFIKFSLLILNFIFGTYDTAKQVNLENIHNILSVVPFLSCILSSTLDTFLCVCRLHFQFIITWRVFFNLKVKPNCALPVLILICQFVCLCVNYWRAVGKSVKSFFLLRDGCVWMRFCLFCLSLILFSFTQVIQINAMDNFDMVLCKFYILLVLNHV